MVNSFGHKIIVKYSFTFTMWETEIKCKLSETVICPQLSLFLEKRIVLFTFKRNLRAKGEIHKLITTTKAMFPLYWANNNLCCICSFTTSLIDLTNMVLIFGSWTRVMTGRSAPKREHARGLLQARKRKERLQERDREIHFLPRTSLKLAPLKRLLCR